MTQKQMRKGVINIENYSGNALYSFARRYVVDDKDDYVVPGRRI